MVVSEQSPTTSTGTFHAAKQKSTTRLITEAFQNLGKHYLSVLKTEGQVSLTSMGNAFWDFENTLVANNLTELSAISILEANYRAAPGSESVRLLAWLLWHRWEDMRPKLFKAFNLKNEHNPFPDNSPPTKLEQQSPPPPASAPPPSPTWPPPVDSLVDPEPELQPQKPHLSQNHTARPMTEADRAVVGNNQGAITRPNPRDLATDIEKYLSGKISISHLWERSGQQNYRNFTLAVEPGRFMSVLGKPTANILIIEDRVSGLPALYNFIHAVMGEADARKQYEPEYKGPELKILDLTGERYLGYKGIPNVVFHPSLIEGRPHPESAPSMQVNPDIIEMVPLLEGAYQAREALRRRLHLKRTTKTNAPYPVFHRLLFIVRWWDVILRRWERLGQPGKAKAMELWRSFYGRQGDSDVNLLDVVIDFFTMGDAVNCQLVVTVKSVSTVQLVGLNKDDMASMLVIVPADACAKSDFGFAAINRILQDTRFDSIKYAGENAEHTKKVLERLKRLVELGKAYSLGTGHQIAFVGLESPQIMPLRVFDEEPGGNIIRLEDRDSKNLREKYEHGPKSSRMLA